MAENTTAQLYAYRRSAQAIEQGEILPAFTSELALNAADRQILSILAETIKGVEELRDPLAAAVLRSSHSDNFPVRLHVDAEVVALLYALAVRRHRQGERCDQHHGRHYGQGRLVPDGAGDAAPCHSPAKIWTIPEDGSIVGTSLNEASWI
mgnify:CR=1 FL=1